MKTPEALTEEDDAAFVPVSVSRNLYRDSARFRTDRNQNRIPFKDSAALSPLAAKVLKGRSHSPPPMRKHSNASNPSRRLRAESLTSQVSGNEKTDGISPITAIKCI